MKAVDLNVDIGEGMPYDGELLIYASSANVCCGVHAGSWELVEETVGLCLKNGVRIGMHPGYPDRASMGRAPMPPDQLGAYKESVLRQAERFYYFVPPAYVKPHGAFYNESTFDGHAAHGILLDLLAEFALPLMGLKGTAHERAAHVFFAEGFADRGLLPDGRLIPRGKPGALLVDPKEVARQALLLAPNVDSLCFHGDHPLCVENIRAATEALLSAGYRISA